MTMLMKNHWQISILVANSERDAREVTRHMLWACGYFVECAKGGVDCVHQLRQRSYDVLLMNMRLCWGGADGVLEMMRDEIAVPCIPVIAIADLDANSRNSSHFEYAFPVVRVLSGRPCLADIIDGVHFALAGRHAFELQHERGKLMVDRDRAIIAGCPTTE